jgi:Nod factor-specific ABC transporter NodJ protein
MTANIFSFGWFPVWRRNFLVWKKLALPSILGNLADPLIYMLGLGYGLGKMLPSIDGQPYVAFLAAGTVCASTMNAATFEALYSAFSRMHVQKPGMPSSIPLWGWLMCWPVSCSGRQPNPYFPGWRFCW